MIDLGSILRLPQTVANVGRVQEIIAVLAGHGWDDLLARVGLADRRWLGGSRRKGAADVSDFERIRRVLEDLGPTFVKLGQLLSYRPDLVPLGLAEELRILEDAAPSFPGSEAVELIEQELGAPVDRHYSTFDPIPLGGGSMAQVHRARLTSGEDVVVKVRRPGLVEIVNRDIQILESFAWLLEEEVPEIAAYGPVTVIEEFAKAMSRELDFRTEVGNLLRLEANFSDVPGVRAPRVFPDLCTEGLLTAELVVGIKASEARTETPTGLDLQDLASRALLLTTRQIFRDRFFHADPHGGNLLLEADGGLVSIDAGMVGRLSIVTRDDLLEMMSLFLAEDFHGVAALIRKAGWSTEPTSGRGLAEDLEELGERIGLPDLQTVQLGLLFSDLLKLLAEHRLRPPRGLALVAKALSTIEGVASEIDPELRPAEIMRPELGRLLVERSSSPAFLLRHERATLSDVAELAGAAPRLTLNTLRKAERGELEFRVGSIADREALRAESQNANRQALAICIGGSLIASAVILAQPLLPAALQVLGGVLVTGSALGAVALALGILRSGRI